MLRVGEGTSAEDGYHTLFGGGRFVDLADHPRVRVTRGSLTSTAAGAYQFLERTWDGLVRQYGFTNFGERNQDLGCVALIAGRNALNDVVEGRFELAVQKCNKEWASLPGSPYGQPTVTIAKAKAEYEAWGGTYTTSVPSAVAVSKESEVIPAFVAAAIPAIVQAVPELVKVFGSGSAVSERNAKAAEVVMTVAKDALGAKNEQEVVETLAADPKAAETVRAAVEDNWYKIVEVGGGIQAAREVAFKVQGERSLWYNPAFVISLILLIFPAMLLVDVFYVNPNNYLADGLRTQIVTGVLLIISMIGGFWLGTSFSSRAKDETIANVVKGDRQ